MKHAEDAIQRRLVLWLGYVDREAWLHTHHSPNGGYRNKATGGQMRAMGCKPGVPDLLCFLPRRGCVGLAVELKAPGGRATAAQKEWLERLRAVGWECHVARGFDEAAGVFCDYLGLDPARVARPTERVPTTRA